MACLLCRPAAREVKRRGLQWVAVGCSGALRSPLTPCSHGAPPSWRRHNYPLWVEGLAKLPLRWESLAAQGGSASDTFGVKCFEAVETIGGEEGGEDGCAIAMATGKNTTTRGELLSRPGTAP